MKIIVAATEFVAAICRTNSNWFEFVRHIAATKQGQATCRSNSADEATCRSDVSLRFVASCVSALKVHYYWFSSDSIQMTVFKNISLRPSFNLGEGGGGAL